MSDGEVFYCGGCGAVIDFKNRNFIYCEFCGAKNERPQTNVDKPTVAGLLERAEILISDGVFHEAEKIFKKILSVDSKCAEAYWGLALSEANCKSDNELIASSSKWGSLNNNIKHAVNFASGLEKDRYLKFLKLCRERCNKQKNDCEKNISELVKENDVLSENVKENSISKICDILDSLRYIVAIIVGLIFAVGFFLGSDKSLLTIFGTVFAGLIFGGITFGIFSLIFKIVDSITYKSSKK